MRQATRCVLGQTDLGVLRRLCSTAPTGAAAPPAPAFDSLEEVLLNRRSCRKFDKSKAVAPELLDRIVDALVRSPTGFNLQGWKCVVVQDEGQRRRLHKAALSQPSVLEAPLTVVFAGDMDPAANAPATLEQGLQSGYYRSSYGSSYLRAINYMLHGGPGNVLNVVKGAGASWYSHATGESQLTVPCSMKAYAWKQAMIPATNFISLAHAAGLSTCPLEGIDEEQVLNVVNLDGRRYTVPVIVACGYGDPSGLHPVPSPRLPRKHFVHIDRVNEQ